MEVEVGVEVAVEVSVEVGLEKGVLVLVDEGVEVEVEVRDALPPLLEGEEGLFFPGQPMIKKEKPIRIKKIQTLR